MLLASGGCLLAAFDFDIQYRRGQSNANADALSRMSNQEVTQVLQTCPQQVGSSGQEHGAGHITQEPESPRHQNMSASEVHNAELLRVDEPYRGVRMEALPAMTKQEIRAGQKEDPVIGFVLHYKSQNHKPSCSERISSGGQVCLLLKEWRRLVVRDDILYRRIQDCQLGVV